jgi:hypothetical protein
MASTPHHRWDAINAVGARRRQLRMMQLIFAGVAALGALGMVALYDAARPDATRTVIGSESVRLTDIPSPNLAGGGGFAADDSADQAQQQAQLQEQLALQDMQQAQMDDQQANDP